ncbi:MAG: hypothetical protein AB7E85_07500 [Pseudobdellovibrionaceae bacterium]
MGRHKSGKLHTRESKSQQARLARAGLIEVWCDGSFIHDKGLKGAAAVYTNSEGKNPRVSCWTLNDAFFVVSESGAAELWAATLALENAPACKVGILNSDCPTVGSVIEKIRGGRLNPIRHSGPLFDRLADALKIQPQMAFRHVTRNVGKIPVANAFAQGAAYEDEKALDAASRRFREMPYSYSAADITR